LRINLLFKSEAIADRQANLTIALALAAAALRSPDVAAHRAHDKPASAEGVFKHAFKAFGLHSPEAELPCA
jgi:hypothetical protein